MSASEENVIDTKKEKQMVILKQKVFGQINGKCQNTIGENKMAYVQNAESEKLSIDCFVIAVMQYTDQNNSPDRKEF